MSALDEYREKIKSGEIAVERLDPMERARRNPESRQKAIAAKCWDCTCGQREEIRNCPMTDCPLYGFRPYKKEAK